MITKWTIGEKLDDKHFNGTFMFPDDLDFIGEVTNCQFFCDVFNDMVEKRLTYIKLTTTLFMCR